MKSLLLYNALTREKEEFVPENVNDVKIYYCGPTVYDVPHLGHARTYIFIDVLRRVLRHHLGYGVRTVMNVTDIGDKIIKKAAETTTAPHIIAQKYECEFFKTMEDLNVEKPDFTARVTDFLDVAKDFTQTCLSNGYAYPTTVDIYFNTEAYLKQFNRVFPMNTQKRDDAIRQTQTKKDPRDFALWKSTKEWLDAAGNVRYEIPGWHTECAAIAAYYFGNSIDIHIGGIDLQFPHHENEIALGRVYFNQKRWVRFCVYTGHLQVENVKMSKSLKNFKTVTEIISKGYSPSTIRYMFLKHSYYKPMNFREDEDELKNADKSYNIFAHHFKSVEQHLLFLKEFGEEENKKRYCSNSSSSDDDINVELEKLNRVKQKIDDLLMNNLNIPEALQTLEIYTRTLSKNMKKFSSIELLQYCFNYILFMTETCFGLKMRRSEKSDSLYPILKKFRSQIREYALLLSMNNNNDRESLLKLCDEVRKSMYEKGYIVEDEKKMNLFKK